MTKLIYNQSRSPTTKISVVSLFLLLTFSSLFIDSAVAVCGDGIVQSGEYCDVGATNGQEQSCCTSNCLAPVISVPLNQSLTFSNCPKNYSFTMLGLMTTATNWEIGYLHTYFSVHTATSAFTSAQAADNIRLLSSSPLTFDFAHLVPTGIGFQGTLYFLVQYKWCNVAGNPMSPGPSFTRYVTSTGCCGNGVVDLGEAFDAGSAINGQYGSCSTTSCTTPNTGLASAATIADTTCATFISTATMQLTVTATGYTYKVLLATVTGIQGLTATFNATGVYFNRPFLGSAILTFSSLRCNTTGSTETIVRTVTSSGCCSSNPACLSGYVLGAAGSCCTQNCGAFTTTVATFASIASASCSTTIPSTSLALSGTSNFDLSWQLFNQSTGVAGLTATFDGTTLTFNQGFTGTAIITFETSTCSTTSAYAYAVRNISMNCCGNNVLNIGEQCDNTTSGSCCLNSCLPATSLTVSNTNIPDTNVSYTMAYTVQSVALTSIGFTAGSANYPLGYQIISAVPDAYTYAPTFPPVWTITPTTLSWSTPYIGTYILNISAPYCTQTGGSFYFTRRIYMQESTSSLGCMYFNYMGTAAVCTRSGSGAAFTYPTRCDCSLRTCFAAFKTANCQAYPNATSRCPGLGAIPAGTCCLNGPVGDQTCGRNGYYYGASTSCPDVLMPKPRTITNYNYYPNLFSGGSQTFQANCPAVCGDRILDVNETCDTAGDYASCCTSTCNASSPDIGFPMVAAITANCSRVMTLAALSLTTTTSNFGFQLELFSIKDIGGLDIPGLSALLNTSHLTFNATLTGTVVVTVRTLFCNATNSYIYYVRTVTVNCCGNGVVDLGEQCDLAANNGGLGGTCCSTQCAFISQSLNYVCRAQNGTCDIPDVCSGLSATCPSDAIQANGTMCSAAGPCVSIGLCDGVTKTCKSTTYGTADNHVCRASTGDCDPAEYCTCVGPTCGICPADVRYDSSHVCRNSTGGCDIEERCDSVSSSCPTDSFQAFGYVCRNKTDECDVPETCSGVSGVCPADGVQPNTFLCRNSTGPCQSVSYCSGLPLDKVCPASYFYDPTTPCRPKANDCDVVEYCPGNNASCPPDLVEPAGTECRASGGDCDPAETCDGVTTACPANAFYSSSAICRISNGTCDPAEYCTGSSALCPLDVLLPSGYICGPSQGACQLNSVCSGNDPGCPENVYLDNTTICRGLGGECDIEERCSGFDVGCPSDSYLGSDVVCNPSLGVCMPTTYCSGGSAVCNVLPLFGNDHICRPMEGDCDVADRCNSVSTQCPSDKVRPRGYVCGPAIGLCAVNTTCTGIDKICPLYLTPSGSGCHFDSNLCFEDYWNISDPYNPVCVRGPAINYDDGLYCNGLETCNTTTGLKIAGTPVTCTDGDSCTQDTCNNVLGICTFTPRPNTVGSCGGGLGACVAGEYQCDGSGSIPSSTCVGEVFPVAEICGNGIDDNCNGEVDEYCASSCSVDADCLVLNPGECTTLACVGSTCVPTYAPLDTPCNDGLSCTVYDKCNGYGLCAGQTINCDDFNECTYDYCSESQGRCIFDGQAYEEISCITTNMCAASSQCNNQGQCVVTATLECSGVQELCMDNICNPETGSCEAVPLIGVSCDDNDACTYNDVCTMDGCIGSPKLCQDFNGCTEDTCLSPCGMCSNNVVDDHCYIDGMCVEDGAQKVGDPCSICNITENAYQWSFIVTDDLIVCDDGNPCTTFDLCNQETLSCVGTTQDCSYLDEDCLVGVCHYGQCITQPTNVGGTCEDDLFCTYNKQCSSTGECVGEAVDCSTFSTSCSISECVEEALGCVSSPLADYTRCVLNEDACDGQEFCFEGDCISSGALNCSALVVNYNPCVEYTCDTTYGCVATPLYMYSCDDGNPCTIGDFCGVDGICYPGWIPLQCDDGNPDTEDSCLADQGCVNTYIGDTSTCIVDGDCPTKTCQQAVCANNVCRYISESIGTRCSDGNTCNGEEYCTGNGVCAAIFQLDCDDNNDCTEDSCDPLLGCIFTPLSDIACDDNNICTSNDTCTIGVCIGIDYTCPEDTDCMRYECHEIFEEPQCIGTPVHAAGSCSVDDPCQYGGTCTTYGVCSTHEKSCPQPTECILSYSCDENNNGACIPEYAMPDQQCNIDNLCSTSFCDGMGNCLADANLTTTCPPQNNCQLNGVCIPTTGECAYMFVENDTPCDDNDLCTLGDVCQYGECIGLSSVLCESASQCHQQGVCDPSTGVCSSPPFPDHYPCNDDSVCSSTDMCISGICVGVADLQCTEHADNPCYSARCDPIHGCLYDQVDGIECDDGNECTSNTTCLSGVCGGGPDTDCFNEFFCGVSYCTPEIGCLFSTENDCASCIVDSDCPYIPCKSPFCDNGTCAYTANDLATSGCTDGQFCNGEEHCSSGTCVLGVPPDCSDGNDCTDDSCDYQIGQCTHVNVAALTSCVNDDLCATASQCDAQGHCLSTSVVECDTSNPCRISSGCDASTGACTYIVLEDGAACANGDLCSDLSVCISGVCNSVTRTDCRATSWCSPSSICLPETGGCLHTSVEDLWCNDENICTLGDKCTSSGVCQAGEYGYCDYIQVQDDQCQVAQCNGDGTCSIINLADETPCSTGMTTGPCSGRDVCSSGICSRTYNPGLICREADLTGCDVSDSCVFGNDYCPHDDKIADGTTCENDIFCYSTVCQRGQCVNNEPTDCSSFDTECTQGYCDEVNKQCTYTNLVNGIPCTGTEWGQCISYSGCYYGTCVTYYASDSVLCSDGNPCTQGETCSGYDSSCSGGVQINCSQYDSQCSVGVCNSQSGLCQAQIANEGSSCNADSNPCTTNDTCHIGTCVAGSPFNCSYLDNSCQYGTCLVQSPTVAICAATITSRECSPNSCTGNCTIDFSWWVVHNSRCVANRQFVWPNNLENKIMCGQSYYSWSQVQYLNYAWRFLFQQWLAATLNIANGACVPANTAASLASAYSLLTQCDVSVLLSSVSSTNYKNLAVALYSYNTGAFGPGRCNPAACFIPPYTNNTCLLLSGTLNTRDVIEDFGDGYPTEGEVCLNGVWNTGLSSCSCTPGWTGQYCDQCDIPEDGLTSFVCTPSLKSPWAYTLRRVSTDKLDRYLSDDNPYRLLSMTGRSSYLPGTQGLDCGCRDVSGGIYVEDGSFSARDITVSATDNDITVYLTTVNEDLTLCTELFDIVISTEDGVCQIDGVYCIQTNPDDNSTSPGDSCGCCAALDEMKNYKEVVVYLAIFLTLTSLALMSFIVREIVQTCRRESLRRNPPKRRQSPSPTRGSSSEPDDGIISDLLRPLLRLPTNPAVKQD